MQIHVKQATFTKWRIWQALHQSLCSSTPSQWRASSSAKLSGAAFGLGVRAKHLDTEHSVKCSLFSVLAALPSLNNGAVLSLYILEAITKISQAFWEPLQKVNVEPGKWHAEIKVKRMQQAQHITCHVSQQNTTTTTTTKSPQKPN